jgi:hypothetical protein
MGGRECCDANGCLSPSCNLDSAATVRVREIGCRVLL